MIAKDSPPIRSESEFGFGLPDSSSTKTTYNETLSFLRNDVMILVSCPRKAVQVLPNRRQSKTLTQQVDDGTGGAEADLKLFARIRKTTNAYSDYEKALDATTNIPKLYGRATDIPNFFAIPDHQLDLIKQEFDNQVKVVEHEAQRVVSGLPNLKAMIADTYDNPDIISEVFDKLEKVHPTVEQLMMRCPIFKVLPYSSLGAVSHGEANDMVVASQLATTKEIVNRLTRELLDDLKKAKGMQRKVGQGPALEKSLAWGSDLVQEFIDSPDIIAELQTVVSAAYAVPTDNDSLISADGQAKLKEALIELGLEEPEEIPDHRDEPEVFPWEEEPTTTEQEVSNDEEPEIIW